MTDKTLDEEEPTLTPEEFAEKYDLILIEKGVSVKGVFFAKFSTGDTNFYHRTTDGLVTGPRLTNLRSESGGSATLADLHKSGRTVMVDDYGTHETDKF